MRKFVIPAVLAICLLAGWCFKRSPAATGSVDPVTLYQSDLATGDHVSLNLKFGRQSGSHFIEGTLKKYDGTAFELTGQTTENCQGEKGLCVVRRNMVWIVPSENVLYIEKVVSEQSTPTTQQ